MPQFQISCHKKKFLSFYGFVSALMSGWEEEMEIIENGPLLIHADKLLLAAMNKYWKKNGDGEWHFVRRDNMFKQSQVLNRLKIKNQSFHLWK